MDFSKLDVFKAVQTRMRWLSERQTLIAENVANADTPGYKPKDLKELDFRSHVLRQLPNLEMSVSSGSHLQAPPINGRSDFNIRKGRDFETTPVGNSVVLEDQMMRSAQNAADYEAMANVYRKSVGLIKLSLGTR